MNQALSISMVPNQDKSLKKVLFSVSQTIGMATGGEGADAGMAQCLRSSGPVSGHVEVSGLMSVGRVSQCQEGYSRL